MHYPFLYSDHVSRDQHILSMKESCCVAKEARVYPLVTLDGIRSEHIDPIVSKLMDHGLDVSFHKARYRLQKGAEEMMVVS